MIVANANARINTVVVIYHLKKSCRKKMRSTNDDERKDSAVKRSKRSEGIYHGADKPKSKSYCMVPTIASERGKGNHPMQSPYQNA